VKKDAEHRHVMRLLNQDPVLAHFDEMASFLERFEDCLSNDTLRDKARALVAEAKRLRK
jgi:hypothetical protein